MRLSEVKCNSLKNPMGIDDRKPYFSWQIDTEQNQIYQTAYRVCLTDEKGQNVWDSQWVTDQTSTYITYGGKELESKTVYTYEVAVKNNCGNILYSRGNTFETGILDQKEWTAQWIGRKPLTENSVKTDPVNQGQILLDMMHGKDVDFKPDRKLEACNTFVKNFVLSEKTPIRKGRAYVTSIGIYELKINGMLPTAQRFAPEFTAYDTYLEYQTYDITEYLHGGTNEVSITLADGWYKGKFGMLGFGENYGSELAALLQLEVVYENGETQTIASDETFQYYTSPYVYADIMVGANYDARLEAAEKELHPCHVSKLGYDKLHGVCAEPIIITQHLKPLVLISPQGDTILDFGQNLVGVVEMKVSGQAGDTIKLEHSEELDKDGNFANYIDGFNRDQTDFYTLKGDFEEVFLPNFTFHGFRYVRVSGYPGEVKAENFTACVLGSDCVVSGTFKTSDVRLNQLQSNILWSQKGNLLSIPTDCPQRERAGWTGDVWVYGETCCFNQDCLNFMKRWLCNMREEQFEDGLIPIIVPYSPGYKDIQLQSFGTHTSAGWGDVMIAMPWYLYQIYGDKSVLEENYEAMKKWMQYVEKEASEGVNLKESEKNDPKAIARQKYLWNTNFHFGDWLYPSCRKENGESDMIGSATTTKEHVATAIYANSTDIMSHVAGLLGDTDMEHYYALLNQHIREAFEAEYVDSNGKIDNDVQGLYVMALAMHMVSEKKRPLLAKQLDRLIQDNHGCLDTGFMSIKFLMDVLTDNGLHDTAKTILFQNQYPSWLYEIEHNATTIWERWNAVLEDGTRTITSYNHYAFGCIGDWMYRNLLGIQKLAPGYKEILIKPDFGFGLSYVEGNYDSVYGTIAVKWRIENDQKKIWVKIPANATAYIELPGQQRQKMGNGVFEYTVCRI